MSDAFGGSFVGNMTLCAAGSDDFPDRGGAAIVPISTLQIVTPAIDGFAVWFNGGGHFGPAVYLFR